MISGIYSPSDIAIPLTEGIETYHLIEQVRNAPVTIEIDEASYGRFFMSAHLPYDCIADSVVFRPWQEDDHASFFLHGLFVGDSRLIGTGVGTRLLKGLVERVVDFAPEQTRLHTSCVRLGALNALNNAFPGRVTAMMGPEGRNRYGNGSDKPLEQLFIDYPPVQGKTYKVDATDTDISGL